MSTPILPFAVWAAGTNQNSIPANDNSLRNQILHGLVLDDATTAQPGSPATGDIYIIASTHTGAQWSTFTPKDLAIYDGATWHAFAPVEGIRVNLAGAPYKYESGAWAPEAAGGSAAGVSYDNSTSGLSATDVQAAIDEVVRNTVSALSISSGVVNINCALGDYFTLALTANVTSITFSNLPGSGKGASLMVRVTQDTTPRTVAWPASFRWEGSAPVVSTGSGAVDLLAITTFNNGTNWDGTLSKGRA